ncbi:hypothetical protein NDU88_007693 [Pleurodeles waltl]|uniref:Uncharacterized protein n=1 Tax=Pleurodeles waltl TaxID=8319 RepID=A0AAV7QMU0_PLEWA|nr:hypothetical protein NDU88_007693 [Pleurodeles waltl]
MAPGRSSGKATHQLLFPEAAWQPRPISSSAIPPDPNSTKAPADPLPDTAMEHILQEISAVGGRLDAMDSKITDLSANSKSIQEDIARFQAKVTDLDHLYTVESQVANLPDNKPELQFL